MPEKIDWYDEFVDLNYNPAKNDLICLYYFEPAKGISAKEAIGRIASESSAGTWTTLHELPARVAYISARAFQLHNPLRQSCTQSIPYPCSILMPEQQRKPPASSFHFKHWTAGTLSIAAHE